MKRVCKLEGKVIHPHQSWVDVNGDTQPAQAWTRYSDEELRERGMEVTYLEEQKKTDPWDWRELEDRPEFEEDGVTPILDQDGNQIITKGLKSDQIAKVKAEQASRLEAVHWYYDRENRVGTGAPLNIRALDQAVRKRADEMEAAITACETKDALKALMTNTIDEPSFLSQWPDPDNLPQYIPDQVTRLQAMVALTAGGYIQTIEEKLTDPVDIAYWNEASVFKRNSPMITKLAALIPLTDVEIDALFIAASKVD